MNSLHVFGDSFSETIESLYNNKGITERQRYSKEYLNSDTFPIWSETLSKLIGYNHKNYSGQGGKKFQHLGQGNSNHSIIYNLNEYCHTFKKDDIVIVGFTNPSRFPWPLDKPYPYPNYNIFDSLPMMPHDVLTKMDSKIVNQITVKRKHDFYKEELIQHMKSFEVLSEVVGFRLYYWTWLFEMNNYKKEEKLNDKKWIFHQIDNKLGYDYKKLIETNGGNTITNETNGKIHDNHMGKSGNDVHAMLMYNYLKNII